MRSATVALVVLTSSVVGLANAQMHRPITALLVAPFSVHLPDGSLWNEMPYVYVKLSFVLTKQMDQPSIFFQMLWFQKDEPPGVATIDQSDHVTTTFIDVKTVEIARDDFPIEKVHSTGIFLNLADPTKSYGYLMYKMTGLKLDLRFENDVSIALKAHVQSATAGND